MTIARHDDVNLWRYAAQMRNQYRLDAIDREILFHLQRDGRLSNVELARRVGLTPPPCLRRVKRLEEAGVSTGYRATVDPAATGQGFEARVPPATTGPDPGTLHDVEADVAGG